MAWSTASGVSEQRQAAPASAARVASSVVLAVAFGTCCATAWRVMRKCLACRDPRADKGWLTSSSHRCHRQTTGLACCSVVSQAFVPPSPSLPLRAATTTAIRTTPQQQLLRATAATALFSMRPGDDMMGGGDGGGGGMGGGAGRGSSLSPVNQVILIGALRSTHTISAACV